MIDDIDRQILSLLQQNARIPSSSIARKVGMATSAIGERMRKLEERGILTGYEARISADAVELGLTAYIYVQTNEPVGSDETAEQLVEIPEVQEVHNIAGEDCYLIKVRVKDTPALSHLLRDPIGLIKTITSTRTTIVLETYKETSRLPLGNIDVTKRKRK
ncbi:MAG: Lrp/AsnC family transcriptional regulator [candidate division Zixibacteria bacterium]|jgi:Lrp/AsnC family leucine-responsive transcriptional regulator|nr:Lrp/AsnC family transcriptional regulator [candidate division Zixibacteria bacterium]